MAGQQNEVPPFGVLAETAGGTNPYFATGAGWMLRAIIGGFAGLKITDRGNFTGKEHPTEKMEVARDQRRWRGQKELYHQIKMIHANLVSVP
jgi:hypothetical protein